MIADNKVHGVVIEGDFIACDAVTLTVEPKVLDKLTKRNRGDIQKILKKSIIIGRHCPSRS